MIKRQLCLLTFLILTSQFIYGQKVKTPKDIKSAVTCLQSDCPDVLKLTIKETADNELINLCYPWNGNYKTIFEWTNLDNKKSKIKNYLLDKGISDNKHQQTIILIAFKQTLLGKTFNEDEIIKPYKNIEEKWLLEDKSRATTDSIRGVYIPKDLEDCFKEIDSFWDDSTKVKVKKWTEEEFCGKVHFGFGMWMRNNWQLWGGSRLSKYFNEMCIYHPDDMSGLILVSYHRHLTGKEVDLQAQIDYSTEYYKVHNSPSKDIYPKGEKNLEFHTSQGYKLKQGNAPACVHIQSNSKTDKVWIYDYHFGWKQLSEEEMKKLKSTTRENREETIRALFGKQE